MRALLVQIKLLTIFIRETVVAQYIRRHFVYAMYVIVWIVVGWTHKDYMDIAIGTRETRRDVPTSKMGLPFESSPPFSSRAK